jgi:hypothetical protein
MAEFYAFQAALFFSITHIFLLTLLFAGIFLRGLEQLSGRVVAGALITVTGTVMVVLAK